MEETMTMMASPHTVSQLAQRPTQHDFPQGAQLNALHGTKRKATDSLENEQRLSKRFDLLNLEHSSKLWTPPPNHHPPPMRRSSTDALPDSMHLEDTAHKVYIHDLDSELAAIEREEAEANVRDRVIFIPDIDRKLNQLPQRVLRGEDEWQPSGTEVVLYSVPSSLSVDEGNDSVRRAIIEARARHRAAQAELMGAANGSVGAEQSVEDARSVAIYDEDAMDLG